MAQHPRLHRRTIREFPSFLSKEHTPDSQELPPPAHFAFTQKPHRRPGSRARPSALHLSSVTIPPSVPHSQLPSTRHTPLSLEAINLELRLTQDLASADTLPSPRKHKETLAVYIKTLSFIACKDSVFGPLLLQLHSQLENYLRVSRYFQMIDLEERNNAMIAHLQDQNKTLTQLKTSLFTLDRQFNALKKENSLLKKKEVQLENRHKTGENDKIERLEEQLKAARIREKRLLRLLEIVQIKAENHRGKLKDNEQMSFSSVVPSELNSQDLKSPLSLQFSTESPS